MTESKDANFNCVAYIFGPGGTHIDLDNFRCFITYFSVKLNQIQFGYICISLLVIIMFLSIFGGIKENYRWFILNQAFWDFAISYRFICENWIQYIFFGNTNTTCFYNFGTQTPIGIMVGVKEFFLYSIDTNSYSSLLLFSFTRFLCLYFPHFYQRLTKGRGIFYLLFIYNFFIIFTNVHRVFDTLWRERATFLMHDCQFQAETKNMSQNFCPTSIYKYNYDFQVILFQQLFMIFNIIMFIKPLLCLLLSSFSAIFLIIRVSKQFKFQYQQNREVFMSSVRICIVIFLQTIINLFVFLLECIKNIPLFLGAFEIILLTTETPFRCSDCVYFFLPPWLTGNYGLSYIPVLQAIVQFRIFIESFIILFIMSGYREALVTLIISPFKLFINKFNSEISVTHVSAFNA